MQEFVSGRRPEVKELAFTFPVLPNSTKKCVREPSYHETGETYLHVIYPHF